MHLDVARQAPQHVWVGLGSVDALDRGQRPRIACLADRPYTPFTEIPHLPDGIGKGGNRATQSFLQYSPGLLDFALKLGAIGQVCQDRVVHRVGAERNPAAPHHLQKFSPIGRKIGIVWMLVNASRKGNLHRLLGIGEKRFARLDRRGIA
jgi:hypothetical protein